MDVLQNPAPAQTQVEQPTVYMPQSHGNKMFSKKNIILIFFLLIIVIALPVGVYLTQKTQVLKSRATTDIKNFIKISGAEATCVNDAANPGAKLNCTPLKTGEIKMVLVPSDANYISVSSTVAPAPTATPAPAGGGATAAPTLRAGSPTATPGPTAVPGATNTPVPTATTAPAAPTATPAAAVPAVPSQPVLDGYCTKNASGDIWTVHLSWNGVSGVHHYSLKLNNDSFNVGNVTYMTLDDLNSGNYLWWVQSCNSQNQCSDWVKGTNFVCYTATP